MPTAYSYLFERDVDTSSEEWRRECECNWLLEHKPTRSQKHLFLFGVDDRKKLFGYDPQTGGQTVKDKELLNELWGKSRPVMAIRGLAAADSLLADAKTIYDRKNSRTAA